MAVSGPVGDNVRTKMQRYDWAIIAWGLWTALLVVFIAYLLTIH